MDIKVNGELVVLMGNAASLVDAIKAVGISADQTGIAVAVNLELVPRGEWAGFQLSSGDQLEVINARQGG